MRLTEAFVSAHIAGAERGGADVWSIVHRSRGGFHLSRYTTTQGQRTSQMWTFPNLYDLLIFAQTQGLLRSILMPRIGSRCLEPPKYTITTRQ